MILVIPVFIPHAGCPHNCCFCNQKIISGAQKNPTFEDVQKIACEYEAIAHRYDEVQLAFYGGSFTAISEELQENYLKAVNKFLKINGGFIDKIRLSTRPDCIDDEILLRLKKYGAEIIELGAQSMDDNVLEMAERGHTKLSTINASKLIKEYGFVLGIQTMPGLPGATYESDIETARQVVALKPDFVRIYPTVVVKQTKMEKDYNAGKFKPLTLDEGIKICAELLKIYTSNNIAVVRLGLQSTDTITLDGKNSEIVAGPYHEAFGALVKSYMFLNEIDAVLDKICQKGYEKENFYALHIYANKNEISDVCGNAGQNKQKLIAKYGFHFVKVKPNDSLPDLATEKIDAFAIDNAKIRLRNVVAWRSKEYPDGKQGILIEIIL